MDKVDLPIITCNDGLVHRDREQTTPVRLVSSARRPSTPGSNWKPGLTVGSRRSREPEKSTRGSRIRSASAGRDPKSELTSRYWSYLFGNLERSISEIYDSCEKQDNVLQCKEVLLILENYVRDFNNLIEWLNLKWSYEQTPPPMRPNALAWEIRKPSLCILPHTRAYEKLVGIVSGGNNSAIKTDQASSAVNVELPSDSDASALNAASSLSKTDDTQKMSELEQTIMPVLSETNNEPECNTYNRVDIGLQTEFDPDVLYVIGGRNIACQTDYCDQYGPLELVPSHDTPIIIQFLDPCDSDTELSVGMDTSMTIPNKFIEDNPDICANSAMTSASSCPGLIHSSKSLSDTCADIATTTNCTTNIDTAVNTVVETKSSATQLSVGVLIEEASESSPPSNDGSGDCKSKVDGILADFPQSGTIEGIGKEPAIIQNGDSNVKTTFADKAKNGMLRQNTQQAKSVPNNMNNIGLNSKASGNNKGKSAPSYRSNIASRCRTAVNTSKQQVLSPVKSKLCCSLTSSAGLSVNPITSKYNCISRDCDQANSKSYWNPKGSGQFKAPISLSSCSNKRTSFTSNNNVSSKPLGPSKLEVGDKKKHPPGNSGTPRQGPSTMRNSDNHSRNDSRTGMIRSKSMINPSLSSARQLRSNIVNEDRRNMGKKQNIVKPLTQSNGKTNDEKNKNFISLPDVSVHRKRNSTVDEDGWEIVRARSSRSKWSPSGSSLSIPLITDTANGNNNTINNDINWKEVDDEGAGEDEEIKKKEEDLDNAIREEELIEEELRQVEKDFEMLSNFISQIENESRDDTTISENDNAPSPDGIHPLAEMDVEKEQFFFICMDDEAGAKAEDFPPREPGRIVALREKLMSPAKRCDSAETLRKYQAKLAKAERNREKLLQAKYNRYVELSERFEALNETTKKLVSEREELITKAEARLQRAAQNRKLHLQNIVRKAHDEEAKAKEIAFINLLEAQNKRHDYLATAHVRERKEYKPHNESEIEGRLQTIQEERRMKLEERSSKALLVIERQSRIRNNWQSKLERMQEKRRKAEERITREKEEKAKERSELAQEKARDREERISALNAAKQAEKEELQKKIQQKQEDTARRHEENMEQIRQKAIELSVPRSQEDSSVPAIVRVCTLCKVSLPSEVQELAHLRGRAHMDAVRKSENISSNAAVIESFGLKYVCDLTMDKIDFKIQVDKNRFKLLKKHCNKLMQRLIDGGMEYENLEKELSFTAPVSCDPDLKAKVHKNIRELDRLVGLFEKKKGTPALAISMDRLMTDIRRTSVQKKSVKDVVISLGVVNVALRVVKCSASDLPDKLKTSACNLLVGVLYDSQPNAMYCLRGTAICILVECCAERLNTLIPEGSRWVAGSATSPTEQIPYDPVLEALLELLFSIMNLVPDPFNGIGREGLLDKHTLVGVKNRTIDIIGYLVTSSVIDRFAIYCSAVRGPIEDQPGVAELLKMILDLLVVIVYALQFCWPGNGSNGRRDTDTTQLLAALESSELAGAVSMSYTLLLHQGAPTRPRMTPGIVEPDIHTVPPPPGERTASIVRSTLLLINAVARVDHQALQNVLGSEAVSLQFRHIASQLLWQVVPHRSDPIARKLLNELLIAIAYFTVGNKHNQVTIQSGQTPTVLQQLCTLPHEFFNEISGIKVLFPTLISATYGCPENIEILVQNHIDLKALDAFMQSNHAVESDILKKLKINALSKITDRTYSVDNRENEEPPKLNGSNKCPTQKMTNGHEPNIKC